MAEAQIKKQGDGKYSVRVGNSKYNGLSKSDADKRAGLGETRDSRDTYSDTEFSRKALKSSNPSSIDFGTYKPTNTIAVSDLNTPTPTIPTFPTNTIDFGGILNGVTAGKNTAVDMGAKLIEQSQGSQNALFEQMNELIGKPPSVADIYKKAQKETGILEKQQKVNDLSGELDSIVANAKANTIAVTGQGRGIPEAIIGGQQAQIQREAAIASLPVSAQLAAAQGNLQMAEQNLNTLFSIRSQDATNEYNYKTTLVKGVYELASAQQKQKLDYALKIEDRKYTEQQAAQSELKNLAYEATKNGAPASVISSIAGSKDFMSGLQAAGQYASDPLAKELQRLQIAKARQDLVPTAADVKIVKINGTDYVQNADGSFSLPTLPTDQKDNEQYSTRASNKIEVLDGLINNTRALNANAGLFRRTSLSNLNNANDWQADAVNIIQKLTVDELGRVKVDGVTFGQLSNGERAAVGDAATSLSAASIKDGEGNPTGKFKMSEAKVAEEFKKIQEGYKLDFERRTGTSYDDYKANGGVENNYLNVVDNALQAVDNPYTQAGYQTYTQ